jgi:NAD-dependent dihydropyrimidine dehydrogenase PreA subunit
MIELSKERDVPIIQNPGSGGRRSAAWPHSGPLAAGRAHGASGVGGERRTVMAYIIVEPCIGVKDKACVEICPVDCIYEGEREGFPDMLFIHPDECIDCGVCQPECPVDAIYPEDDVPEEWSQYIQINADYFK